MKMKQYYNSDKQESVGRVNENGKWLCSTLLPPWESKYMLEVCLQCTVCVSVCGGRGEGEGKTIACACMCICAYIVSLCALLFHACVCLFILYRL